MLITPEAIRAGIVEAIRDGYDTADAIAFRLDTGVHWLREHLDALERERVIAARDNCGTVRFAVVT